MGPLLDLAVLVLLCAVLGSLALLGWTLGVTAVLAIRRSTARVAARRAELLAGEQALVRQAAVLDAAILQLAEQTRPKGR